MFLTSFGFFILLKVMGNKFESLSNGVDDLENFTSEMEWSFFVPVGFSCVFSNWYSYVSTPPAFPLAWIHVWIPAVDSQSSNALRPLSRAPRLCPVAVDITMLTRRKLRLEEVYSERLSQKHFQRQLLISAMRFLKLSRFLNPKQLRFRLLILRFIPSTGPLEKSYSTLLRTAVMFFFKVEMAVSMFWPERR